ncbi:MAG: 2Fe-2S iron-sulfur cluster binding domain-containing protein [Bdellovibrionales bacterium]|nr:2Fe-2S iron-sulfur cluster binding domain-containing protein [Bdellovibrionales bacterium]
MSQNNIKSHKVTLRATGSENKVVEIEEGKNLLVALRETDTYIKSSCGGHATCTDCIIKIVSGEDNLTPPPFEELKLLGNVFHITKERLACQTMILGDVTIDITKHDKASDEARLKNKTSNFSKKKQAKPLVRKESDIEKVRQDKEDERIKFETEQKQKSNEWKNHWEKDKDAAPKKLAGSKRPKYFNTDKVDYENDVYTRPLSPEKQKLRDERLRKEADDKASARTDKELVQKSKEIPESDKEFKKFR